jgi:hypothetical protein
MDWIHTEHPFGLGQMNVIFHEHNFVTLQGYGDSWLDNHQDCIGRFISYCKRAYLEVSFAYILIIIFGCQVCLTQI